MWRALLVLGLAGTAAYALAPLPEGGKTRLFVAVAAVAATAAATGRRRGSRLERRAWLWTAASLGGFVGGRSRRRPVPGAAAGPVGPAAGLVLLLSCVPLAFATGLLGSEGEGDRRRSAWVDATIVTAVAALIVWDLLVAPTLADATLGGGAKAVDAARPLVAVLLTGLVLRLLLARTGGDRRIVLFAGGTALLALGALVFSGLGLAGSFAPGHPTGAIWLAGYLLAGFAAVEPPPAVGPVGRKGQPRARPRPSRDRAPRRYSCPRSCWRGTCSGAT